MGNIEYSILINTNKQLYKEKLKIFLSDIEKDIFPHGNRYPISRYNYTLNYISIRTFIDSYNKCKYLLIYLDDSYYIQKMIFYCDYINRHCPYINYHLSFEIQQILDEIKELEENYFNSSNLKKV